MEKIIYKKLPLLLVFLLLSCESFLDEDPKELIDPDRFYVTEADGVAAITGIYFHLMHNQGFGANYIDDYFGLTNDHTTPSRALGGRIFFGYRWDENTSEVREIWRRMYMAINDANVLIKKVPDSNLNEQIKSELIAEAVFLRGFTYYYLVAIFGDVPYVTEPTIDAASFEVNVNMDRMPVDQIRQSIIEDLAIIEDDLPATPRSDYPQRATRWAAKSLKLKTYLWLEDYANAVATAQDIVNNSGHSLLPNYEDVFRPDNEFNNEIIFQFDYIFNEYSTNRNSRFQPRAQDENRAGGPLPSYFDGFNNYTVYKTFADTFAPNDLRRKSNVYNTLENGTPLFFNYIVKQWRPEEARGNSGLNYKFFRFGDVLLNLAEAENELNGPTDLAYGAINQVRERAGLDGLEGLTQDELREAIKQERSWELIGEGTHRKMDLLRWNELENALNERLALEEADPGSHPNHINNLRITLQNYAPYKNLLPIPAEEILLNPRLTQNAGYTAN
jgi:hypothetical protein